MNIEENVPAVSAEDEVVILRQVIANLPVSVFTKDADTGRYRYCNQQFAEYAGKASPSEVVGLNDLEIFDLKTAEHFITDDRRVLSGEKPESFEEDVPDPSGNVHSYLTVKTRFTGNNGDECLLGLSLDRTADANRQREILALSDSLREERDRAIEAEKAKSYFSRRSRTTSAPRSTRSWASRKCSRWALTTRPNASARSIRS